MPRANNGDRPGNIKDQSVDQGQNRRPTGPGDFWKKKALDLHYREYEQGDEWDEQESICQCCLKIPFVFLNLSFFKEPFNRQD